jgi:quercetin dioxygenase-like cupin family protein
MSRTAMPVTLGSPWFRTVDTAACRVTEARFSAGDILRAHSHDRPIMAVMLSGSFETASQGDDSTAGPTAPGPSRARSATRISSA